MKRFRFPLRPVAVLRAHRQARAREAFAASVHRYVQAEEHLAGLRARRAELETVMHDGRRGSFRAADEVSFWGAYRRVCDDELKSELSVIEARADMDKHREEYMAAHRDVKVVEKLEHHARNRYRLETERAGQVELDEMASRRFFSRAAVTTEVTA